MLRGGVRYINFNNTADWFIELSFQMLWGTSSLALYIPWAGKAGPYLGISLWLWLGVLDAIQGVGLGMILLQVSSHRLFNSNKMLKFPDFITSSCLCYPRLFTNHRFNLRHGCASNGTQSSRTWHCISRCG